MGQLIGQPSQKAGFVRPLLGHIVTHNPVHELPV